MSNNNLQSHVLIAPLGLSPGAVSGLAFALRANNFPISQVITIGTSHADVQIANNELDKFFEYVPEIEYDGRKSIISTDLRGKNQSCEAFIKAIGQKIRQRIKSGAIVHVGVTSGRSGMGALASLSASLYNAHHLWHFWVDDTIADRGNVTSASYPKNDESEKHAILNPTYDKALFEIVALPFMPLYEELRHKILKEAALHSELGWTNPYVLENIFPEDLSIADAKKIQTLKDLTPEQKKSADYWVELGKILERNNIVDEYTRQEIMKYISFNGPATDLADLADRFKHLDPAWHWISNQFNQVDWPNQFTTALLTAFLIYAEYKLTNP